MQLRGTAGGASPSPTGFQKRSLIWVGEPLGAPAANESVSLARKPRRSRETAPATIFARPGPSGPVEISDRHSDFARRKCCKIQQVRVPRNGVRGKATMSTKCPSAASRTKCPSAASPAAFWLLCRRGQSNSPRRAKPLQSGAPRSSRPTGTRRP